MISDTQSLAADGPSTDTLDDPIFAALDQGVVLIDAASKVLAISRRADALLFTPAGVTAVIGEDVRQLIRRTVASDLLVRPDGINREDYAGMMEYALANDVENIQIARRDMPALRASTRTLADGRKVLSIVEHVLGLLEPIAASNGSRPTERLPVVVAREGFETPPQLAEALEFMEEGFALYDEDCRFVLCNRRFCELLFVDPEARPRPGELMDDIVLRAGQTNAGKGRPEGMSIEEYAAHSTAAFKSLAKNLHYELDDGKIMEVSGYRTQNGGYLYTLLDVTEREESALEAERQRVLAHQSEKLSALGELLAGVAHELNNPLSIVVGFSQMLEAQITDPQQLRRIAKVRAAAERSARIVKTFLAMARQRPARIESAEPSDLVTEAADIAAYGFRAAGGEVTLDIAKDLPPVMVDKDQLVQVLSNLIINAEQAMKGRSGAMRMVLQVARVRDQVEIAVSDTGPGMNAETQSRIFEPFFTTKDVGEGTGFGLAFCHRIVTAHGGTLRVESELGKGSTFTVSLRAAPSCAIEPGEARSPQVPASMDILVVDDERDVAELLVEMLAMRGHRATAVHSPMDAVRVAQRERFDAIISDMKMPGMMGDQMMALIVESRPALAGRFGFVTGDSLSPRVQAFLEGGTHPFIEKPIVADELDALLARLQQECMI